LEKIRSATRRSSDKKDSAGDLENDPGHVKQSHRYVVTAGKMSFSLKNNSLTAEFV